MRKKDDKRNTRKLSVPKNMISLPKPKSMNSPKSTSSPLRILYYKPVLMPRANLKPLTYLIQRKAVHHDITITSIIAIQSTGIEIHIYKPPFLHHCSFKTLSSWKPPLAKASSTTKCWKKSSTRLRRVLTVALHGYIFVGITTFLEVKGFETDTII